MRGLKCIVLDFDGTLTDPVQEGALFERRYRANLASATSDLVESQWQSAAEAVDADPESHGMFVMEDVMTAPGDADIYIRCVAISQRLNRELHLVPSLEALHPLTAKAYAKAYKDVTDESWSSAMFRPGVSEFLDRLRKSGLPVWVVSNGDPGSLKKRLERLPGGDTQWLELVGNAQKYLLIPPTEPSSAFDSLPEHDRLPGLARPVKLKRGPYLEALLEVWRRTGAIPQETLVVGDIYDVDLALPAALGARVHLVENRSARPHYRSALAGLGGRGSYATDLMTALKGEAAA
jgi:FMN phosphatase YigB (HAD superfamily)